MIHLRLFENETAFETAKDSIEKPWVAYTEEEMITHYMPEDEEPAGPTYEYVDLGLPSGTKWATCNLGASTPTEYGDYYMWGSTTPNTNDDCSWVNAPFNNGSSSFVETYFNEHKSEWLDENNNLKPEYDAVYQATGGAAHMPTEAQYNELLSNTTNTWVNNYEGTGVNGRLFTSKTDSSKNIFFPASGGRWGSSVGGQGSNAGLWSSTLYTYGPYDAWSMYFFSDDCYVSSYVLRCRGFCVRGVL